MIKDVKLTTVLISDNDKIVNKNIDYVVIKNTKQQTKVYIQEITTENGVKNKLMIELNIDDNSTIELRLAEIIGL